MSTDSKRPTDDTEVSAGWLTRGRLPREGEQVIALVIAWSLREPDRIGEVGLVDPGAPETIVGRGHGDEGEPARIEWFRQRPGSLKPMPSLASPGISRKQLRLVPGRRALRIERIGKCGLLIDGAKVDAGEAGPGSLVMLDEQLLFYVTTRPRRPPSLQNPYPSPTFGEIDTLGIVGESPAIWRLRDDLAFRARRDGHVLIQGESGTGKELAARAIHALSTRATRPFVARNAATFPPALIDAELFGNARNYPNAGMPERAGLIGEADTGTLFLDEIAELPIESQAHLLRVLDGGGEYQRLGDAQSRRADLRVVAATNRPEGLKHDLAARLTLRLALPGLADRREDVPLLARHLLRAAAKKDAEIGRRFFDRWDGTTGEPRIDPKLVARLLQHRFTHHVRELDSLLWTAMASSTETFIALTDAVVARLGDEPRVARAQGELDADAIRDALARSGGNVTHAARALGLKNRDVLKRLLKKHGIR